MQPNFPPEDRVFLRFENGEVTLYKQPVIDRVEGSQKQLLLLPWRNLSPGPMLLLAVQGGHEVREGSQGVQVSLMILRV